MARVFSYVVRFDSGFAPNPWHGFCTLACCKPSIRRTAEPGDLIVGMSSRCERVVYMMRVDEKLDFASYWCDPRFRSKRADARSTDPILKRGDNIYEPLPDGGFRQHPSNHWDFENNREDVRMKRGDLKGRGILVATDFVYFGGSGSPLPDYLSFLKIGRAHRCRLEPDQIEEVERFFRSLPRGVKGSPALGQWRIPEPDSDPPRCS